MAPNAPRSTTPEEPRADEAPECAECDETAVGIAWCDAGVRPVCALHMNAYITEGVRTTLYDFAELRADEGEDEP